MIGIRDATALRSVMPGIRVEAVVALALAAVGVFARLMTYPLQHDEEMFVSAGVLLQKGSLYYDFGYNHLPNLPILYNLVYELTGTGHYLLTARLITAAMWAILAGAIIALGWRATRSSLIIVLSILFLAANDTLLGPTGMTATNTLPPLAFLTLGLWLLIAGLDRPLPHSFYIAGAGAAVALAAGTKINFVVFLPPFLIAAALVPRTLSWRRRWPRTVLPMLAGMLIAFLPTLTALVTEPRALIAHVIGYHLGPHRAYWSMEHAAGTPATTELAGKAQLAFQAWTFGVGLLVLFCILLFFVCLWRRSDKKSAAVALTYWPLPLVAGCILLAILVAFVPTPAFPQYYALPMPLFVVLLILGYGQLDAVERANLQPTLLSVCLLAAVIGMPRWIPSLPHLAQPHTWTGEAVHKEGRQIAAGLAADSPNRRVATLAPIYALEGGLEIYPELAVGPFVYRVAPYLSEHEHALYRTTSPDELGAFLAADPPAAILLGFEGHLEKPFLQFATAQNYDGPPDAWARICKHQPTLFYRRHAATQIATPLQPAPSDACAAEATP